MHKYSWRQSVRDRYSSITHIIDFVPTARYNDRLNSKKDFKSSKWLVKSLLTQLYFYKALFTNYQRNELSHLAIKSQLETIIVLNGYLDREWRGNFEESN